MNYWVAFNLLANQMDVAVGFGLIQRRRDTPFSGGNQRPAAVVWGLGVKSMIRFTCMNIE